MREPERAGKQPRSPACLRSRLNDTSLDVLGEQTRAPMWPTRAIQQTRERRPLGGRRRPPAHDPTMRSRQRDVARRRRESQRRAPLDEPHELEPAPRREPRVRVLHPGLRSSVSFSTHSLPAGPDTYLRVLNLRRHDI
jgi:hypothetical protein